jgi:hypothetical protein
VVKVGIDIGLFTTLEKSSATSMSTEELAHATHSNPELLGLYPQPSNSKQDQLSALIF